MKKIVIIFCLFTLVLQLVQIVYFKKSFFATKYDTEYWKDRYEHSQYQLPLSKRIIGDDGLFAYSGYRLILGDNPFSINNDKPPVAKYFFGLSILFFQNPLYAVLFFGFCTLVIFYLLTKLFFKNNNLALFATVLLFLDPLFFSQFWITGLDLIQLFFLLLNVLLLINVDKFRRWNWLVTLGAGLSLGLFVEVKPPILLPVIFILETAFLFFRGLKKEYVIFVFGFLFGIILPYAQFIHLGNGIVDILKVHKFMASIYLQSQLKAHVGAIWLTLFVGKFPDLVTGSLMNVAEWWIFWPILTLSGVVMASYSFVAKKIPVFNKGLAAFLLVSLIVLTMIPSYPRYLVLALPFLYLFGINFFQSFLNRGRTLLYSALLIFGIINSFFFLLPKPDTSINGFYYNLSRLYFHDVYQENIADGNSLGLTRDQFRYIANKTFNDAGIREIAVKELARDVQMFATTGTVKLGLTYKTQDLGSFYEEKIITLIRKDSDWKIKWDWDIVLNDFRPGYEIESQIVLGKRGSIISRGGAYLAKDFEGYLLSVNPEKISLEKEQAMLKTFSNYGYRGDVNFQNAYLENVLPNSYVPILTTSQLILQKEKENLLSYPGVMLAPYRSRLFSGIDAKSIDSAFYTECCTRVYSSYNYHGIKGLEKELDKTLWGYSGGKILMKDDGGAIIRVVLEKDEKDGQDVVLN